MAGVEGLNRINQIPTYLNFRFSRDPSPRTNRGYHDRERGQPPKDFQWAHDDRDEVSYGSSRYSGERGRYQEPASMELDSSQEDMEISPPR